MTAEAELSKMILTDGATLYESITNTTNLCLSLYEDCKRTILQTHRGDLDNNDFGGNFEDSKLIRDDFSISFELASLELLVREMQDKKALKIALKQLHIDTCVNHHSTNIIAGLKSLHVHDLFSQHEKSDISYILFYFIDSLNVYFCF